MTSKFKLKTVALIVGFSVLALTAITASAQWQWVEKDGRKIFSDRAPPAEIAEKDILKRPPGAVQAAAASAIINPGTEAVTAGAKPVAAPATSATKASAPKLSGKDSELEARKKKADEDEAAKKKAEEEKVAKGKAETCGRAKTGLTALQSGMRMSSLNAKGEPEIYDDAKRALETKRVQEVIDATCK